MDVTDIQRSWHRFGRKHPWESESLSLVDTFFPGCDC